MNNDLAKLIESIGFSEKEAQIYLTLLESGKAGVSTVSKRSGIKRPTTYVILEELAQKGYATLSPGKKILSYQAVDPSVILIQKRTDLKNFAEMVPFLQTIGNKGGAAPKIHYIADKEGILNMYESLNFAKESLCISSYAQIDAQFPGIVDFWIKGYEKKSYKTTVKHMIPDSPNDLAFGKRFKAAGQDVRVFPRAFDTDIVITENKVALSSLSDTPFLVLIESEKLARSLRPIFDLVWEAGSELS
ncbi:MAG TPA: helix-turn-helix domain-containing protein [Candidatus Fimivivens sp.]|nr:helix-turn-helix domain-containing protein [Candidatus Fimivivens sp.]